jgi:hypothetical protein
LRVANLYTDCLTDSNSYEYAYPDAKRHTYGYSDSYGATESYTNDHIHDHVECYGNSYSHGHIHDHAECYGNSYCKTDAHCPTSSDAQAATHASAASGRTKLIWFRERRSLVRRPKGADWKPPPPWVSD